MRTTEAEWYEKWPAPAKLNLMLRIIGRRADGYHLLQTVFQMTDLCDWLSFFPLDQDLVTVRRPIPGVLVQDDLTVRAAKLLKQKTQWRGGVCIDLEKCLPMGGGLGGGSSDAATTLVVLNRLWKLGLSVEELMVLALKLGADVPVFVYGHAAWGEGVGENLQAIDIPEQWVVIVKPDCHVNTKDIFLSEGLTRNSKPIRMENFLDGDCRNDCVGIVSELYPQVKDALDALSKYSNARLTGTGACVFAQFATENAAREAYKELGCEWSVYLAKGVNRSPLHKKLEHGIG